MKKVLYIDINPRSMAMISPTAILFSSIFKRDKIEFRLFDTTYYEKPSRFADADEYKVENLGVKDYRNDPQFSAISKNKYDNLILDVSSEIEAFNPDVVMVSLMESTFLLAVEILDNIRHFKKPHVVGGVFAMFAPEVISLYSQIDIICVGEGENVIVPLVRRLANNEKVDDIPNLWIRSSDGSVSKTRLECPVNLNDNPVGDISIYEEKRLYRSMAGKMYKMIPVESHRGCLGKCAFCGSALQNKIYLRNTKSRYFRKKSIPTLVRDIRCYVEDWGAEYLHFWADNFFSYSWKEVEEFCVAYDKYRIPFYVQSFPSTIDERKLKALVDVGLDRIGFGVEHGNQEFRRRIANRNYTNSLLLEKAALLHSYDVPFSTNSIVGFPEETPELHEETVVLNRMLNPDSAGISIFTPFYGTPLRRLCIEAGYLGSGLDVFAPTNNQESILNMPQFSKDQILGKARTFNLYLKLPETLWEKIKKAEEISDEGNAVLKDLKNKYL